ncbi:response regulator [Candidatus Woesebacteria bacterium]|nr:response regulator [Candidatus Woesebacteria bacterium]
MNNTKKYKLLVVEDEDALRQLYVDVLQEAGYEVVQAKDGEVALKLIKENQYDLILLDIILPHLDGLQLLEKLQKDHGIKDIGRSVVLLTNLGQELVVAKALEYNVRGYMVKSDYTPDELIKEIHGYLSNHKVHSSL